ncbi:MAG: hypothetical protein P0S94_01665, partial [Simkaniaceae bacterium]|nr:hypothetical protein [Simkaniaceae bacterium]
LFNKHNVTPAEEVLRQKSAYYTDIGFNKSGIFYDQFEVIHQNRRVFRLPTLEINLLKPKKMPTAHKIELPKIALERENNSKIYFYGDIFDRSIQFKRFRESLIKFEKKHRRARFDIYTDYSKGEAQDLYLYYKNKLKLFVQHTGEATESREKLQWKE